MWSFGRGPRELFWTPNSRPIHFSSGPSQDIDLQSEAQAAVLSDGVAGKIKHAEAIISKYVAAARVFELRIRRGLRWGQRLEIARLSDRHEKNRNPNAADAILWTTRGAFWSILPELWIRRRSGDSSPGGREWPARPACWGAHLYSR